MTIEERFEKIEKQNRRLRRLSLASIALALAALIGGTALSVRAYTAAIEPDSVTTKRITLKDGAGRVRVALDGGSGNVWTYDVNGKVRTLISSDGYVAVFDYSTGAQRARMSSDGNILSYDAAGKPRGQISATGEFTSFDAKGTQRARLAGSILILFDDSGRTRAQITGSGYFTVFDANGQPRVRMESTGVVMVLDPGQKPRVALAGSENKIYFWNASGKIVATYPK